MSGTVDDRIVAMQFDNAQFEQKMGDTLKSLDQLNKSLDFTKAQRNLGDLSDAGNRFNMGRMGEAVEGVSAKFLAMATIGITAISNITNRAVNAGVAFLKSFAFGPITDGFHEMETAIGATQTILANTARFGTKLPEVQANLKQLNDYADKTIYNFGEMTKNVGLFTNAGIRIGDATSMIKGFSNAAAASGTTAEGAAGAAYQLSQALSTGTIRLMDWRSLTNVGMGNKNMQDSLIEIADKMKSFAGTGITATDVQKDFNGSLEKGWLSSDVMSTYLKIMAGDMDAAKLKSMGFTAAQIKGFQDQQVMAENAATKVRTATQLIGTVKEAIGSGWSETFSIVLGNFDEATTLFTDMNNFIGGFVGKASEARNNLLQGWKDLGGRTMLIQGFRDSLAAVGAVLKPIKEAFREFFPPKTAQDLMRMTTAFTRFAQDLYPMPATVDKIKRVFVGVFAVFDIVINVVLELKDALFNMIGDFKGVGSGALGFAANLGDLLAKLDDFLVNGGNLHKFFLKVDKVVDIAAKAIKTAFSVIISFFKGIFDPIESSNQVLDRFGERTTRTKSFMEKLSEALGRLKERWSDLSGVGERLKAFGEGVAHVFEKLGHYIGQWFSELGQKIAASLKPGDFDTALDALNIGLLGGIVLMLRKFLKGGINLDVGGGIFGQIKETLEGLTGQLKAMQTELKAKALMEIAIALGVLTLSIVVLSMIDSAKLTKAMTALAIGFGELVTVMKLMDTMASGARDAAKFGVLAIGMTLLATAALILSGAVAVLAQLSWEELAKGLGAVTILFAVLVGVADAMEGSAVGLVAAGLAMIPMATGLVIMAGAVKLFATMSWAELAKGLVGLAAALGIIAGIMMAMPSATLIASAIAMIPLATGLTILAGAIKLFATMSWGEMLKGMVGLAASLGLIALGMSAMPATLPITAAGLVLVAIALNMMVPAIMLIGRMPLGELAKGIGGIGALLLVLAVGVTAMSGAIGGALALIVVAGALAVLTKVIQTLGGMSLKELALGIGAIAAVILVLGISAAVMQPIIPALLALGLALGVVGAAFALFGVGAFLIAKAFEAMASAGVAGMAAIIDAIILFVGAIPRFVKALVAALTESAAEVLKSADLILRLVTALLDQLLDTVIKLAPKIAIAIAAVLDAALVLLIGKAPALIETGFQLLMKLLSGFRDHIGEVTTLGIDILVNFIQAMNDNVQKLIDGAVNLLLAFLGAIAERAGDITAAGENLLLSFLAGMINNVFRVLDWAVSTVIAIVQTIANEATRLVGAGADILINFVTGLGNNVYRVVSAGVDLVIAFIGAIGGEGIRLARGAADALIAFINGLAAAIREKSDELRQAGVNIAGAIMDGVTGGLASKAGDAVGKVGGIFGSLVKKAKEVVDAHSPSKVFAKIGRDMIAGTAIAFNSDTSAESSVVAHAERIVAAFQKTLSETGTSLGEMDEFNPVITPVLDLTQVKMGARGLGQLMTASAIRPEVSIDQARLIATTSDLTASTTPPPAPTKTEITFNQYNNSPKALSTNDIYKNTNSALAKTKEELDL